MIYGRYLERMRKEAIMAYSWDYPGIRLEELKKKNTKNSEDILCPGPNFYRVSHEYKSEALSPELLAWLIRSAPTAGHE
jgi:hypothetical protein